MRLTATTRVALWVFLSFTALYTATTRGHFVGTDEIALYQTTRSLWERGDFAIGPINNTFAGRDGLIYSQYSPGQSVLALPLYGAGRLARRLLDASGASGLQAALAGPNIGDEPSRWGGELEMFFVNLFNVVATALLCAIFFLFSVRLGASGRAALASTALLGLTSYVAPFSTGFLQHSSEALFLLAICFLLFLEGQKSDWRLRVGAGIVAGVMILFRLQSGIALPAFGLYLLWGAVSRRTSLFGVVGHVAAFLGPVGLAIAAHAAVNVLKFESVWGRYNNEGFHTPLLKGLYAFLLSPGASVLLFTPLLLLLPWTWRGVMRRHPAQALLWVGLSATYLIFYSKYTAWHGLWSSLGPRYLVAVVPLLLLPLGLWLDRAGVRGRTAAAALGLVGFTVQVVHVAVNFGYVYHRENYLDFRPEFDFLFVPDLSPLLAHGRALLAADYRVDMWLVNVHRDAGAPLTLLFLIPLLGVLAMCASQAGRCVRELDAGPSRLPDARTGGLAAFTIAVSGAPPSTTSAPGRPTPGSDG